MRSGWLGLVLVAAIVGCAEQDRYSADERRAFEICATSMDQLTRGSVVKAEVPEVQAYGSSSGDFSFAWNGSRKLKWAGGEVTGSCTVNRFTGKGFATLMGANLGDFTVNTF